MKALLSACLIAGAIGACDETSSTQPTSCDATSGVPESATIGPSGGVIALPSGATLLIPPGAVPTDTSFELAVASDDAIAPLPDGYTRLGPNVVLRPHGFQFAAPVTIVAPFTGDPAGAGVLRLSDESDTSWEHVVGFTVGAGAVTFEAKTLSVIAVVGVLGVWTCGPSTYGAGDGCTCGCGVPDSDCGAAAVAACDDCRAPGSCGALACTTGPAGSACGAIEPSQNDRCRALFETDTCSYPVTCFDGRINGAETAVDCGGDCGICPCATGTQDNDHDGTCTPECATAALGCGAHAACEDGTGTATCVCEVDYQDYDHDGACSATCIIAGPQCGTFTTCEDASGTAICLCDDGFQDHDGDGDCSPTCATQGLACQAHAACADASGTAACECEPGYQDNDGDTTCEPDCATAALTCQDHASCADTTGVAACSCDPGYQDHDNDGTCAADCATAALVCQANAECRDAFGTAVCRCVDDFQDHDGDGSCLVDCAHLPTACGANSTCSDTDGTADCGCDYGYQDRDNDGVCEPGHRIGPFPPLTPDPQDHTALAIIQTQPAANTSNHHPLVPISVFFDDEIDPATISEIGFDVVDVTTNTTLYGTVTGELSAAGNTIMHFTRVGGLPPQSIIKVTLTYVGGIKDDNGNALAADYSFQFGTGATPTSVVDLGFEVGDLSAWLVNGDAAVMTSPQGDLVAPQGTRMASLSTGPRSSQGTVLSSTPAVDAKYSEISSALILVPPGAVELVFDYDFASQEFDNYVGSQFDDEFRLTVAGDQHAITRRITSVNTVGKVDSVPVTLPQAQPSFPYQHTGWRTQRINLQGITGNLVLMFTVTDVSDRQFGSIVWLDRIHFE